MRASNATQKIVEIDNPGSPTPEIPDKLYFRIGDVAKLAGIKPYVLRYWETEFPGLGPKKSGTGHRLYRRKDVETVLEIKRLLYDQRFTIEGARKTLEARPKGEAVAKPAVKARRAADKSTPAPAPRIQTQPLLFETGTPTLDLVRAELRELIALLR